MNETQLLYEDPTIPAECDLIAALLRRWRGGRLLCSHHQPVPGLPLLEDAPAYATAALDSPWGTVVSRWSRDLGDTHYHLSCVPWYELRRPDPTVPLPSLPQAPVPGVAVLDLQGRVQVYLAEEFGADDAEAVWMGQLTLEKTPEAPALLRTLRLHLAQDGIPVLPAQLRLAATVAYPYPDLAAVTVSNGEAEVNVVGYAVDPETQQLVYLHLVGYKTALLSLWGSLHVNGNRLKALLLSAGKGTYALSSRNYLKSQLEDLGHGLYRLLIVDRRAVEATLERAYLLLPRQVALDRAAAFAVRLAALIPLPIPTAWGATLFTAGQHAALVQPCLCGGDVEAYIVLPGIEAPDDEDTPPPDIPIAPRSGSPSSMRVSPAGS